MSNQKKPHDEEAAKTEREKMYKLNLDWLLEQEANNLGEKHLPRSGDNGTYSNNSYGENKYGEPCGLPKGKVYVLADPDFQKQIMNCPHLKAAYPKWKWNSNHKQDLSAPLATEEQVQSCMDNIRATLAENKSKNFSRKQTRIYL